MMVFAPLREQIRQHQAHLAEQLEAVDQAETALAKLADVFGLPLPPAEASQDAQERRREAEATMLPPEPASPAVATPTTPEQGICAECSEPFQADPRSGGRKRFCSSRCRVAHNARKAKERKVHQQNGATPSPVTPPEPEPPPEPLAAKECDYCTRKFTPSQTDQRFCSKDCKLKERRDRKGYGAPSDWDDEMREVI